jgi:predicted CXXCH cytochrome family protein
MHHETPTDSGMMETWLFLRTPNEDSDFCMKCHLEQQGGPAKGNHSMQASPLRIPKELINLGVRLGTEKQVICESCHIAHGGMKNKFLVLPTEDLTSRSVLCEVCHSKYPSIKEGKNLNSYSHSVDVMPDTAKIPSHWNNGTPIVKGRGGEVVCRTCHTPHNAIDQEGLLVDANERDSLCLQCHLVQQSIIGTKHDLKQIVPKAKNILKQKAKDTGPCRTCHLTHQGTAPFMCARQWKEQEEPMLGICQSCHSKGSCAKEVPMPESSHPMGIEARKLRKSMEFPLYTSRGKKDTQGSIYCSSCHNTHRWDPLNPDNKGSKDVEGDITNSFLRAAHQGSVLCLGCHKEESAIEKTDHDLAHSAPDEKNKINQSPEESGICGTCHLAHGGADTFMWGRTLKEVNDAPMAILCLECHSEGSCAEKKLIGEHSHPIKVSVEDPQEISFPLFLPEGKQDPKGMVFCSTCHDPHQWDPSDPDKKGEDGTHSDSFLRLASAGNSPLCTECHRDKSYIEGTDHDLRVTAPKEKNKHGILPQESGLCEQCHAIHNAPTKSFIWNRELGPSTVPNWKEDFTTPENIMVGLCSSCHLEDECAEEHIPEYGLHPSRLYMAMMQEKSSVMTPDQYEKFINQFPIFTDEGEKSIQGNIVCSTCHDAHLWDAYHPKRGAGEEIEGNATNSFLRKNISFTFCASCHGEDALYKFKYFHFLKGRTKD